MIKNIYKYYNKFIFLVLIFLAFLASLHFLIGIFGLILADKQYIYDVGCGLNILCSLSQAYYTTNPFIMGFKACAAALMIFLFVKFMDKKLIKLMQLLEADTK